jgi:predicted kinase
MIRPKVILLNGFAGSGKTTIAKMFTDNHSLAMRIEADELIVTIGDWLSHEDEARTIVDALIKKMLETATLLGHDVIIPYLVSNSVTADAFKQIAEDTGSDFFEFYLKTDRHTALRRLLARGTWGEAGSPPITSNDIPLINNIYDQMETTLRSRLAYTMIKVEEGNPTATYEQMMHTIRELV